MLESRQKFKLLTRSDLDGLVCAVLMKHLGLVETIELIDHPGSIQNRRGKMSKNVITTNLPYVDRVYLAFDHHFSEAIRNREKPGHIIDPDAPSAARVVYEYYGGEKSFPAGFDEMMKAVDKADSGNFTKDEILHPDGWPLLNFLIDRRTGMEDWSEFALKGKEFGLRLIDWMSSMSIEDILNQPDIRQRTEIYFRYETECRNQLGLLAEIHDNVILLDFRKITRVYPGNRFVPYALYPECNVSVTVRRDKDNPMWIPISAGKSVINIGSDANVGELMLSYGGGGHRAAGACYIGIADADRVIAEIISSLSRKQQGKIP